MNVKYIKLKRGNFYKIKISPDFVLCPPNPEKINSKMLTFFRECYLEPIIVDENYFLVDGYCSYLIAKQVGTDFVKIKQVRVEE